jgi:8-oxo-dGTP diphosphatase
MQSSKPAVAIARAGETSTTLEYTMTRSGPGFTYTFPMTSVATDIAVFHVARTGGLQVALVQRNEDADAYPGAWALPGGFFRPDEDDDIKSCVLRELSEEAGLDLQFSTFEEPHVELVDVYSAKKRDPRPERVISIAHLAVLKGEQSELAPIANTDVSEAKWFPFEALEELELAFDHKQIIEDARRHLAESIGFARKDDDGPDLLFAFLPDEFTLSQAQSVVQALKGEPVDKSNFRKYIERFVVRTGASQKVKTRPAALYRRRSVDPAEDAGVLSSSLARLRQLAEDHRIRNFEVFLASMTLAPTTAVRMVSRIVATYGRHRDYLLKATKVPDLRIDDERTERVLMTLKWQPQKKAFFCTALVPPGSLSGLELADLKEWNTGPHKSAFRLGVTEEDLDRLDVVLSKSAAALPLE